MTVQNSDSRKTEPYPEKLQVRGELTLKTFEYVMPFNYENTFVDRRYGGGEFHGVELFPLAEASLLACSAQGPGH